MRRRPLPDLDETLRILREKRTVPARRPPPPAGRALRGLMKELDGQFSHGASALIARWREIVGEDISRRTEPVKLIKGRNGGASSLEIRVAGPSAAIIQHQAQDILTRVNVFLGPDAVQKLRIVQGPLQHVRAKPVPRRRAPLDAAQEAGLAESLATTPDGRLKDALLALGRGVLRRGG